MIERKDNRETKEKLLLNQHTVYTGFVPLEVETHDLILNRVAFSGASESLPGGFKYLNTKRKQDFQKAVKIKCSAGQETSLRMKNAVDFEIEFRKNDLNFSSRFPYLCYTLSERIRQEEMGMYTLHAGAVVLPNNKSLLILGDKGQGKTSLCLSMNINKGLSVIGDDLVILQDRENKMTINGGNSNLNVRQSTVKNYFPEYDKEPETNNNLYEKKIKIIPQNKLDTDKSYELAGVVRISLHKDNQDTVITSYTDRLKEILRLNENFTRYIRGNVTPLNTRDGKIEGFFPCLDTPTIAHTRNETLNKLLDSQFIYATGSNLSDLTDKISSYFL